MNYYHSNSGQYIGGDGIVTLAGTQYPAGWLANAPAAELERLGLVPVEIVGERGDDRYFDNSEITENGTTTIVSTPKPTALIRAAQIAQINASFEISMAAIQLSYPASEVLSWQKQEAEARAFVANQSAPTPLIDALAQARNIDKGELAARVIVKADAFASISGAAIGKRQALEDAINALPSDAPIEQITAITWL